MGVQGEIEQRVSGAGWELDGSIWGHLVMGHDGDLSILVDVQSWDRNGHACELYDVDRHLSYSLEEIPTPRRAATLIEEHGEAPGEG